MAECIFCKIAEKKIPAQIELEDDDFVVFKDINPQAPVHYLLIPKKHMQDITELQDEKLAGRLLMGCVAAAQKLGLFTHGFRLVVNTKNHGGQTVYHLHFHILGGRHMGWPPG
ncbi:MAG: histidine triad nucleotide-binding protein [Leptospiraceae bacterium]|nr:histidine triad nucleotide-binding protein [Leptospiraceae bacterium]MDW8305880.1 histidine triad nucleotide-binding protein [Leptospiraceae bacterium]